MKNQQAWCIHGQLCDVNLEIFLWGPSYRNNFLGGTIYEESIKFPLICRCVLKFPLIYVAFYKICGTKNLKWAIAMVWSVDNITKIYSSDNILHLMGHTVMDHTTMGSRWVCLLISNICHRNWRLKRLPAVQIQFSTFNLPIWS